MSFRDAWRSERAREIARFLATGVMNTVLGFAMFVVIQYLIGTYVTYVGSLLIAHFITSLVAFILYRKFVFRAKGGVFGQFWRFQTVYIIPLGINILLLPTLVEVFSLNVYVAQAIASVAIAIGSYFAHRYFSFKPRPTKSSTEPDL